MPCEYCAITAAFVYLVLTICLHIDCMSVIFFICLIYRNVCFAIIWIFKPFCIFAQLNSVDPFNIQYLTIYNALTVR